jgi:hypothetical protein
MQLGTSCYLRLKLFYIIYRNSIHTSYETYFISVTKADQLMLFREIITAYCEVYKKGINTPCGKKVKFLYVETSGIYSDHWASND